MPNVKPLACLVLLGLLAGCARPAAGGPPSVSPTGAAPTQVSADYSEAFGSVQGCAVLFDETENTYSYYNRDLCETEVSPLSTFKIVSALMGLHNGVITSAEGTLGYDGTIYPVEAWNADLTLKEAFQSSCVWYFRKVLDTVGQTEVQRELDGLDYGNRDCSDWDGGTLNPLPELNGFWLDASLKISPARQVEVLRSILEGESLYTQTEITVLKDLMRTETGLPGTLYGKTGSGRGHAWFVGLVENEGARTYFAVYLDDTGEIDGTAAKEIALRVLSGL